MIIGQDKLLNSISNSLNDFPKTNLFVGELGSGRKSVVNYISEKLQAEVVDITDKISLDLITDIYLETDRFIYVIDVDKISVKDQNTILKFIEEPPKSAIIFLLTESPENIVQTVVNRCFIWNFERYSIKTLKYISNYYNLSVPDDLYRVFKTPGKIITAVNLQNLQSYKDLAEKIVKSISKANYVNCLKLTRYFVPQKDEDTASYNLDIFLPLLHSIATDEIKNGNDSLFKFVEVVNEFSKKIKNKSYNKKMLLDKFFYDLRGSFQ